MTINGMEIKRFPKDLDPNTLLVKAIVKKYGICPFCHNDNISNLCYEPNAVVWMYADRKEAYDEKVSFIDRVLRSRTKTNYHRILFTCNKCGGAWYSDWFPEDIDMDKEVQNGT